MGIYLWHLFCVCHTTLFWVCVGQITCLFSLQISRSRSDPRKLWEPHPYLGLDLDKILNLSLMPLMEWNFGESREGANIYYIGKIINVFGQRVDWQFKIISTNSLAFFLFGGLCSFPLKCISFWLFQLWDMAAVMLCDFWV